MESASLATNSLGSPAVALHETIFIYIFIASLIMAKFPSSFLQLFKGFSPVANSFASMSFRKVISVACQLQGCRKDRNSSAFFTPVRREVKQGKGVGSAWSKTKSCTCSSLIGKRKRKMQYLLKQSEMENKEKQQKQQKGENPSIDQNCNSQRRVGVGEWQESEENRIQLSKVGGKQVARSSSLGLKNQTRTMAKINRLATTGNLLPTPSFSALPVAPLPSLARG